MLDHIFYNGTDLTLGLVRFVYFSFSVIASCSRLIAWKLAAKFCIMEC